MDNLRLARQGVKEESRRRRVLLEAPGAPGTPVSRREHPGCSLKRPVQIEVDPVTHHVIAGPGHLVLDRLPGDDHPGIGELALTVALDPLVVSDREVTISVGVSSL
jgi:hypothetical protein